MPDWYESPPPRHLYPVEMQAILAAIIEGADEERIVELWALVVAPTEPAKNGAPGAYTVPVGAIDEHLPALASTLRRWGRAALPF